MSALISNFSLFSRWLKQLFCHKSVSVTSCYGDSSYQAVNSCNCVISYHVVNLRYCVNLCPGGPGPIVISSPFLWNHDRQSWKAERQKAGGWSRLGLTPHSNLVRAAPWKSDGAMPWQLHQPILVLHHGQGSIQECYREIVERTLEHGRSRGRTGSPHCAQPAGPRAT